MARVKEATAASDAAKPPAGRKYAAKEAQTGAADSQPYLVTRTSPEVLKRHDISDEELTMLTSHDNRTFEQDVLWVSIGATFGSLAPAIAALNGFVADDPRFGFWELAEVVICMVSFVVASLMGFMIHRRPRTSAAADLAQAIRDRTAKKVGSSTEQ